MTDTQTVRPDAPPVRRRLGELLIAENVLDDRQLRYALDHQLVVHGRKERLGQAVVRLGFASEQSVGRALARQLQLEFIDDDELVPDAEVVRTVSRAIAERHQILPMRREDDTLVVACTDPTDVVALDDIRLTSGSRRVRGIVATPTALRNTIERIYGIASAPVADDEDDAEQAREDAAEAGEGPIVQLAESIIARALLAGASDLHIEPREEGVVIRLRIDGVLQVTETVPPERQGALISRLKLMSGMDIAERRRPQDGRANFTAGGQAVDLRVSTLPSMHGEKIVIRLLRKGSQRISIDGVGLEERDLQSVLAAVAKPQGLVLITGPTGSGKTSTLYSFLEHLRDDEHNIITLEDPVEYELAGVNQTQIHERIGFTFAKALRTVLRQDPDIVMLGEIRDPETAELALQASLTGHLVFSTLHTNSATGAIVRLRDLGIPSYLIASAVTLLVAQRLARRVCPHCAVPATPSAQTLAQLHLTAADVAGASLKAGAGCTKCDHTGYKGRVGVFEVVPVDAAVRDLLAQDAGDAALRRAARLGGMRTLREDGLRLAFEGGTTLEEVLRVTPEEVGDDTACPVCALHVDDDFVNCPWCGVQLRPAECATCARELERGWKVCPRCATPVPEQEGAARPAVVLAHPDPNWRSTLAEVLRADYEVHQAGDLEETLAAVSGNHPAALVVHQSLRLGEDVVARLHGMPDHQNLPVVLVANYELPEGHALSRGVAEVASGPLQPEALATMIKRAALGVTV